MGGYLKNRVESLKKTSFVGGVVSEGKVDHGEVDWLELCCLSTH